jgi:tripartite-type tricarboxylate transporter receptor subunit TctC
VRKQRFIAVCGLLGVLAAPTIAAGAGGDEFYNGKTITLIESGATGAYDAYARAFARCMPRYIAGNPTIVVQGKLGAAGVVAANYLYNVAPRDGTVIGTLHGYVLTAQLLAPEMVKYDPRKFSWIGNATHDTYVGYVMSSAPIRTLAEAKTTEVLMAGTSVGSGGIDMAILGRDLFGFKFKIIRGYKTSAETELALERGEANGTFGHAWGSLKTQRPDWLQDGKIRLIVQHGFARNAELPDTPLLLDFAQTDLERQVLSVELVRQDISKPYVAPPGVPPGRLAVLRNAFQSCLQDTDFVAEVKQRKLELDRPMGGEELSALVMQISQTPAAAVKKLQDLLSGFRGD